MKCGLPAAENSTLAWCRHHRAGRSGQLSIPKFEFVFVHRILIPLLEYRSMLYYIVHFWQTDMDHIVDDVDEANSRL